MLYSTDFVDPSRTKDKGRHPYSYSEFYIWRDAGITGYGGSADISGVYSDRMQQWDSAKYEAAFNALGRRHLSTYSKEDTRKFLKIYYPDEKYEPVALIEGCNISNGYPYWIFLFRK